MFKIKQFLIVLTIILLINPISFAQIISAEETLVEDSFIEIKTSDELASIKDDLTENYVLTNDIDLKDEDWGPIESGEFTGTLIGNEFKIKNMPAKYIEDENLGLFTEVADLKNIDVDIEFGEETPQVEEEAKEHQAKEEIIEEESRESLTKEEREENRVDEEQEGPSKKANAIEQSVSVGNYNEFKAAIEDEMITEINLTANISRGLTQDQAVVKARELVIDGGESFELHSNRITSMIAMDGNGGDITFKNLKVSPTRGTSNNFILTAPNNGKEFKVTFENITNGRAASETKGGLVNAENAHVIFKGINKYETNGEPTIINNAKSFTVEKTPEASNLVPGEIPYESTELHTKGKIYHTQAENAKLHVKSDGLMVLEGSNSKNSAIELEGQNSEILVEGRFLLGSNRNPTGTRGGLIKLTGANSQFNVRSGATVGFSQLEGSILYMSSENGSVNIEGEGTNVRFAVKQGDGSHDAAIHFNRANGYKLNVSDQAQFEVVKEKGSAMGIRVGQGTGHEVNVKGSAKFKIHNKGTGTATDTSSEDATNQALFYNGTLPEFNLEGAGSEVELIADSGVAMHMTGGGEINVNKGTTMIARGKTASPERGIIDTGGENAGTTSTIKLSEPQFYDFRNNNTEGLVFYTATSSILVGYNTEIAFWERKKNKNLDGPHDFRFLNVGYFEYENSNFTTYINVSGTSEGLKKLHKDTYKNGLASFSRVSGNNAQAIVSDVYTPTNADKKAYAHVLIDEGIYGQRDAYTDEVEVDILINGIKVQGKTKGKDQSLNKDAYEIYGKLVDAKPNDSDIGKFGWVEFKVPDELYLKENDILKVEGARVLGNNLTKDEGVRKSDSENLFQGDISIIDVTPPEPTKLTTKNLTTSSTILEGKDADPDATVIIKVNDEIVADNIKVANDGTWEYEFKNKLKVGDKVQAFLTDNAPMAPDSVLGDEADRPDRPETHTSNGNINPEEEFIYHDKIFKPAPILKVIGELKLDSVPDNLNFNPKITSTKEEYLVNLDELGKDLIIKDDRFEKSSWKLTARMSEQLTDTNDRTNILTDALIYRNEGIDVRLNDESSIVEMHEYGDVTEREQIFNLSSDPDTGWGNGSNGVFVEIEAITKKAEYLGEVEWTLSDAP